MSYTEQELALIASLQQDLIKINSALKDLKPLGFTSRKLSEIRLKHGAETLTIKPAGVEVVQKLDLKGISRVDRGNTGPKTVPEKRPAKKPKKPNTEIKPLEVNPGIDKLKGVNQDRFSSILDKAAMAVINK